MRPRLAEKSGIHAVGEGVRPRAGGLREAATWMQACRVKSLAIS